jgi:hypothetical protein
MVFMFSMFRRKVIALAGAVLLFFVTALLTDFWLEHCASWRLWHLSFNTFGNGK